MGDLRNLQPSRRADAQEISACLRGSNSEKKRNCLKKIINGMVLSNSGEYGAFFPDVVSCMQTNDLEIKKMVYLYVAHYAKTQPELAILAVNTFRKDALDPNPLIR